MLDIERISAWKLETMSSKAVMESHGNFEHVRRQDFGGTPFLCEHDVHLEGEIDPVEGSIITLAMVDAIVNCARNAFPVAFGETLCVIVLATHGDNDYASIVWHCHLTRDLP